VRVGIEGLPFVEDRCWTFVLLAAGGERRRHPEAWADQFEGGLQLLQQLFG